MLRRYMLIKKIISNIALVTITLIDLTKQKTINMKFNKITTVLIKKKKIIFTKEIMRYNMFEIQKSFILFNEYEVPFYEGVSILYAVVAVRVR